MHSTLARQVSYIRITLIVPSPKWEKSNINLTGSTPAEIFLPHSFGTFSVLHKRVRAGAFKFALREKIWPKVQKIRIAGIVVLLSLSSSLSIAGEAPDPATLSPEDTLWEIAKAERRGDFESAWDASLRFFQHPQRNTVSYAAFQLCFLGVSSGAYCSNYGGLQAGAYLGKARREVESLDAFCPPWGSDVNAYRFHEGREKRWYSEDDGCMSLGDIGIKDVLHPERISRNMQSVDIVPIHMAMPTDRHGFEMPVVDIDIGGQVHQAILDTGASLTSYQAFLDADMSLASLHEQVSELGISMAFMHNLKPLSRYRARDIRGVAEIRDIVRLPKLQLGRTVISDILVARVYYEDGYEDKQPHPLFSGLPWEESEEGATTVLLGMNALIHRRAVCFAWKESKLYLGDLGPCAGGIQPYGASVAGLLSPRVEAWPVGDAQPIRGGLIRESTRETWVDDAAAFASSKHSPRPPIMIVDTGASHTVCSERFIEDATSGEDRLFTFGKELVGRCSRVSDSPIFDTAALQAILGMDTLLEYAAFGWELNPLRLYFVPDASRTPDAEASASAGN